MTIERIEQIESHIRCRLQEIFARVGAAEAPLVMQKPPRPELGDVAVPCFPLAKLLRQAPPAIAKQLAGEVTADEVIARADSEGGFLNLYLNPAPLIRATVGQVLTESGRDQEGRRLKGFGGQGAEEKKHVVVEYSSPNTNKPLHLGHVRNNTLGLSVCRILAHAGHDVSAVCLVNDRGIHICKTMVAYQHWGEERDPAQDGRKGDHYVGELYVEFANRFDIEYSRWLQTPAGQERFEAWRAQWEARQAKNKKKSKGSDKPVDLPKLFKSSFEDEYFNNLSPLGAEARELLRRWEAGDEEVRGLWQRMNDWVYEGFDQTYRRLGVAFDKMYYESQTYTLGREVVDQGLEQGLFHRLDDGAAVADYKRLGVPAGQIPYKVLLRGDGTTVYTTQDLGTALARHDELHFDRQVYVVGDEQKHHFRVLFALLALVRPELADACFHLAYGMVNLPEGKMKSREGKVVDADNLMDDMAQLAADELRSRSASGRAHSVSEEDQAEIMRRAEVIAQGAIKFYLLSFNAASTMTFDPQKSIDFLGKTGPYCLNAFARTRSVIERAGGEPALDLELLGKLGTERELNVVRALAAMPDELRRAEQALDPAKVVDAVFEVARAFNQLYTDKDGHPIVTCDNEGLRQARLLLTNAVSAALETGLYLLGIDVLEEM
jgi:arginyl-tRNA synthetase